MSVHECYVPLLAEKRTRSLRVWLAVIRRSQRRRVLCALIGHRWSYRTVTDEVWPQHRGHTARRCDRCWKTEGVL